MLPYEIPPSVGTNIVPYTFDLGSSHFDLYYLYSNSKDYKNTLEWMHDIEFVMTVDVKNNNIEKQNKYKIMVSKNDIEQARIREKKSNEALEDWFEGMDV